MVISHLISFTQMNKLPAKSPGKSPGKPPAKPPGNLLDKCSVETSQIDKKISEETFKRKCTRILREQSISKKELIVFFRDHIVHVFNIKVFGSAVMSMFSGIEPNDIDLYIDSKQDIKIFSNWMISTFGSALHTLQEQIPNDGYRTIKLLLVIGEIHLKIDIVTHFNLIHCFTSDFVESRLTLGRKGFELLSDPEIEYDQDSIPWLIDYIKKNLTNKTLTISASHCIPGVSHLVYDNKFRILQRVYAKQVSGYVIKAIERLDSWDGIGAIDWYKNTGDWTVCKENHASMQSSEYQKLRPFYTKSMTFTDTIALPGLDCIVDISVHEMRLMLSFAVNDSAHNTMCDSVITIVMSYLQLYDPDSVCTYCFTDLGHCDGRTPHMKSMCLCDPNISDPGRDDESTDGHDGRRRGRKPRDPRNGVTCERGCNGCQYIAHGIGRGGGRGGGRGRGGQRGPYHDRSRKDYGNGFKYYYNRAPTKQKNHVSNMVFHFDCFTEIADNMNPMGFGAPCNNICNDCLGRFFE